MLTFFRRGATEKVMLGVLLIALIAIVITGFGTQGMGGIGELAAGGNALATVNGAPITEQQVQQQVQRQLERTRAQQPDVTAAQLLSGGAFEQLIRDLISQRALVEFARDQGITASKRTIDGEIASIPAFHNLAGQFDANAFRAALAQQRMTEQQLRGEIADSQIQQQLFVPVAGAGKVPGEMAKQYAALLLEKRDGAIGMVPAAAMGAGAEPTPQELNGYYQRNIARYTIPERRVIRYAAFGRESLGAAGQATPAEIEAFYRDHQDRYGPTETRTVSQVVLPNKAAADAFAAKLAGGATFAAAAQQAGFSAADTTIGVQTKAQLTSLASAAVADAAFAAAERGATAPVQSPFGWHIVRVDKINRSGGKPLAAATEEIRKEIEDKKVQDGLADKVARIEDKVDDGSSLEEVARAEGLTIAETPPITATGTQPGVAGALPIAELQPMLEPAFDMQPDDDPTVQALVPNQRFALFEVKQVIAAAAPPLAQIGSQVKQDFLRQRATDRARAVASQIAAKINRKVPPAQAFAEAGVPLPKLEQVSLRRMDIARQGQQVPPPLALLFSLPTGHAQIIPAPQGQGWFVVANLAAERGDATKVPGLIQATGGQFREAIRNEYAEQFVGAVQREVSVRRNETAIGKAKADLSGTPAQ